MLTFSNKCLAALDFLDLTTPKNEAVHMGSPKVEK